MLYTLMHHTISYRSYGITITYLTKGCSKRHCVRNKSMDLKKVSFFSAYTLTGEKCHDLWHKTPHSQLQRRHQDPIAGCGWDQPYRNPTSRCRSRSSGRCYPGLQIQCNCHDLVIKVVLLELQTKWKTEHLEVPRNVVTLHHAMHATHATHATTSQLVWTK